METHERAYVVEHLDASEKRLLALTEGLTEAQWTFQESPERWSIAGNIEHCILVETLIAGGIQRALAGPKELDKKQAAPGKDKYAMGAGDSASRKIEAQPVFHPTGRWPEPAELLAELRKVRAGNVAYAKVTEADLRDHFFPHQALGDLDCYQWLVIMAQHGERHAKQIEQIKANPNYPA